jgi:hypothetical protein
MKEEGNESSLTWTEDPRWREGGIYKTDTGRLNSQIEKHIPGEFKP